MVTLSQIELERTFPFFFSFRSDLRIIDSGKSLKKLFKDDPQGDTIPELFELEFPKTELRVSIFEHYHERLFIFKILELDLSLRGQISKLNDDLYYFLGAPWIVDGESLNDFGLNLNDFAIHDPISDLLNVISAQKVALVETQQLTEILQSKQQQLSEARDHAEDANRAKTLFLANMSHELRTPMNAILGYTQLMQRAPSLSTQFNDFLSRIRKSGSHLLELLDDLLEMSKIESGNDELHPSRTDLYQTVNGIWEMCAPQAQEKKIRFPIEFEANVPEIVNIDYRKLRQILLNVIGNAIKFTEDTGEVSVHISYHEDTGNLGFKISDTGVGIASENIESIFQPFERAGKGRHSFNGTGLGLAICKRFVDLMGGTIQIESRPDIGSTFYIEVPVETLQGTTENPANQSPSSIGILAEESEIEPEDPTPPGDEWLQEMREAAESLDFTEVENLLATIESSHPNLHFSLSKLAADFRYEEISDQLQPNNNDSPTITY